MVARNKEKMEEKIKEVVEGLPGENRIETMIIVADFSKMDNIDKYREIISKPL